VANKTVKIGLVQLSCSADLALNLEKTIAGLHEVAAKGA
jgi:N-carbamoylputrescine amidase